MAEQTVIERMRSAEVEIANLRNAVGDLRAHGYVVATTALKAKDRSSYQFSQGWNAALDRFDALLAIAWPVSVAEERDRPLCLGCKGPHRFDTSVPSVVWNAVVRSAGLPDFLCTTCVVEAFAKVGRSFTATLWGEGFAGLPIEIRVNEQPAHDAEIG